MDLITVSITFGLPVLIGFVVITLLTLLAVLAIVAENIFDYDKARENEIKEHVTYQKPTRITGVNNDRM